MMNTRIRELIAIGASVTANCSPCLRFHVDQAREAGTDEAEIRTAVRVGRMVRKGAAANWDAEATALLGTEDTSVSADKEGKAAKPGGCC